MLQLCYVRHFQEPVNIDEIKRILSFNSSKCVAKFTVNGVSWNVCVANRDFMQDAEAGDSAPSDAGKEPTSWSKKLMIYVTMQGRPSLKNYELCIQRSPSKRIIERVVEVANNEKWQQFFVPRSAEYYHAIRSVRSEIILRHTFFEGEKLYFPIDDPGKWIATFEKNNNEEKLSFHFKVRPITYQQKCADMEFYFRQKLSEFQACSTGDGESTAGIGVVDKARSKIVPTVSKSKDFQSFAVDDERPTCSNGASAANSRKQKKPRAEQEAGKRMKLK